ncbi:hypothetical protein F5H01DRAFT_340675 [Linnemannia elongata]|nr:hypothetical protein F5H01DRAFT_340675 [Linnemannia elongata]
MDSSKIIVWQLPHSQSTSTPEPPPPPSSPQKSHSKFWTEIPRTSRPNYNFHSSDDDITSDNDESLYISDVYRPPKPVPERLHRNQEQQEQQEQPLPRQQQQRVSKPALAPNAPQRIPTKDWLSSIKSRIAHPIERPPLPPSLRPITTFDAHVKATLRRLNRYMDTTGPQLPPSESNSDSDPPRIKKDNHGLMHEPHKDTRHIRHGIERRLPPQTQTQAEPTEPPDADVGAVLDEMSGSDEDLNKCIYSLRKESCERLASAWQSIFDRFGNSDVEQGSEVDFAEEGSFPWETQKVKAKAKLKKPGEGVFKVSRPDSAEDIYSPEEEDEEEDENDEEGEGEEFYEDDDDDDDEEEEAYESLEDLETEEEEFEGARRKWRTKNEEGEEEFLKAGTNRLNHFLKDDEEEETVRVRKDRINHEQQDEERRVKDAAEVIISDSSDPSSPFRHRAHPHKWDRYHHYHKHHRYRLRQGQEEQDRSEKAHHIPKDHHHHHGDTSRLFNLFDASHIDRHRKEESRVLGSDVDIQVKSERRYSHSVRARHWAREDEEAAAKGTVVRTYDFQSRSHRRDEDDSMDTFNFHRDQPSSGPLPKSGSSDLMIMRRAFNKWRWYSASRHDCSARSTGDPQEGNGKEDVVLKKHQDVVARREEEADDDEAVYDADESDTDVGQQYQSFRPRQQQQQQQHQQMKEEELLPIASPTSPIATKNLTFESTALYNRSGTLRLHMKPQTRALAAALSPRKRVPPTSVRLLDTASGLNPFAAGDSNWKLSDADGMQPSPPPFSDSPSPTGNIWSSDAFPDFSLLAAPGSSMTTPRKRHTQEPPVIDLTTPKAQRFMSIDDLYRLHDEEHESASFSNLSGTAEQQYTRLLIPTTPPTLPANTHQQDYGFFDSPASPPPPPPTTATALSSSVEALYKAATESEFGTYTFLPRQQPEEPPVPVLALNEVDDELLHEMNGLSTAPGTPRKSRAVVDPVEARLMTPKTKALASLLMSKKKTPSSPSSRLAAGAQSHALVSKSVFSSRSVPILSRTVTVTPPISSSATTPNPSISPSPPPPSPLPLHQPALPSCSATGAGAPLFQMHSGYPMGERGTKRQYGQDDDDDDGYGNDDDGLESFKVVKSESQHGIFHSPRPLS